MLGGVARPSLEILAVQGQRATQLLVKPQSVLCSAAEDPTFGWLLGGCWEIPLVKENEVWMEITKRSQFFAALRWREALATSILLLLLLLLLLEVRKEAGRQACFWCWPAQ